MGHFSKQNHQYAIPWNGTAKLVEARHREENANVAPIKKKLPLREVAGYAERS